MSRTDELLQIIDNAADAARQRIVGDAIRVVEYQVAEAEADATAFKNADYTGAVPPFVGVWAQAKNWTAQQAADSFHVLQNNLVL